ncbi:hypothetical protein PAMP_019196 [Pampus punctatissimus]
MAHFLLDNTTPQEALLLDDEQIPLKECKRLDQSLALALKHLTLCHQWTAPEPELTHSRDTFIEPHSHTDAVAETRLDNCSAQCQQHSSLLHLAAAHGLKTVASFLLQQPGGREALRQTDAQGQTPACLAKTRGHQQLLELFTQYETSSDVLVEPKDQLHFHPGGRTFQYHSNLGTYTLTFPGLKQREEEAGTESSRLQEEVEELRRLIQLERDKKGISDLGGTITLTHASKSINHKLFSPDGGLQPRSNSQQESKEDAGPAAATNCDTLTEERGSPSSLEKRKVGEDSAAVTQASCTTRTLCQSQETGGEQKATPAANSHASRNRKNKKKTTKTTRRASESPGNNRSTPEAFRGTAPSQPETTGSRTEEALPFTDPVVASVTGEARDTKHICSPITEETQLPINPVSGTGDDGNCAGRNYIALPSTTIVEKQEGEKWEVKLLISDRVVETEILAETKQRDTGSLSANEAKLHSAAGREVTMGQEQSRDPQESQLDPDDRSQPDSTHKNPQPGRKTSPKSPDAERKLCRVPWRDGGRTGSRTGSAPHGAEIVANTIWYQCENLEQEANEDSNIKASNSHSVWYDGDTEEQRQTEQLEQGMREQKECDLSSSQASGIRASQLLEQGLSSRQLSAALSQPHAVGTQPALSHGPGAQRREVHGSQQEEEVGADWKEGGREEVSNRKTTRIRKSSETAEIEEGGEERPEGEEIGAKGRKKRRKKRGKRGGAEPKLSSSIESQSQIEVQARREQGTNPNTQSDTESDITGRTPEPTRREEADKDTMHLPSQADGESRSAHGPDRVSHSQSTHSSTEPERTELTNVPASQGLSEEEIVNFHGPDDFNPDSSVTASEMELKGLASPDQQTMDNVESKTLSAVAGKAVASVDGTGLVEPNCPEELPVRHSDPTEFTEDSFIVEFPEQNTQHVRSVDTNKPVGSVDPMGNPTECMESEQATGAVGQTHLAGALSFEGTADVTPLQIREGSAETTAREYLEHCFASEMLREQQHKEEMKNELLLHGTELFSTHGGEKDEGEEFPSVDREQEQKYNEDLVAAAVAVVTVAIASALASVEVSQRLADQESASKATDNDPPLTLDANIPSDTLNQLVDDTFNSIQSTQLSAQLINKDNCQLLADSHTTETETIELSSEEEVNAKLSAESHSVELQSQDEGETSQTQQLDSNKQSTLANTPALPQTDKEEIQSETKNKLLTFSLSDLPKENSPLEVNIKSLPEGNEIIITKVDSQGHMLTDIQLQQDSLSCPVIDTGQHPEDNPESGERNEPQDDFVCRKESDTQAEREFHSQENEGCDKNNSSTVASVTAEDEAGRDSSGYPKAEQSERCEKGFTEIQARKFTSNQHLDGHVQTPSEGEIPTLPPLTLPVALWESPNTDDDSTEELPTPVNLEFQSSHSLPDTKPDAGSGSFQCKDHKSVATDNKDSVFRDLDKDLDTPDAVDRWKERDGNKMKSEEEAKTEMVTAADTFQTEAETFSAAKEEPQHTRSDSDSIHTLQIQRERDVFYPAHPCPEPSTVTCSAVHPDREECLSVCLLQSDTDVSESLKPVGPAPRVADRGRGIRVSLSSTNVTSMQRALSPNEGASSVDTSDTAAPWNSMQSSRAETGDREGKETEGGGEEEEKKDKLPENPISSAILRASIRSLSPFRRHSWEPGRSNATADIDGTLRSSFKSLSGEVKRAKPALHRRSCVLCSEPKGWSKETLIRQ